MTKDEPEPPLNPYESPRAESRQFGPFLVRLARATRRGVSTYWSEIRKSEISSFEHIAAWLSLAFFALIAAVVATTLLWLLSQGLLGLN